MERSASPQLVAGGDHVDPGLGVNDSVVFIDASHPALGRVRRKLRAAVWIEYRAGGVLVVGDQLDRLAVGGALAPEKIWQPVADQAGRDICVGGYLAGHLDLRRFLPICDPLDRGLV